MIKTRTHTHTRVLLDHFLGLYLSILKQNSELLKLLYVKYIKLANIKTNIFAFNLDKFIDLLKNL